MTTENRQCVLCLKLLDPGSGIEVDAAGGKAWVCDECKADFCRIRTEQLALEERMAQPGWLATELPPNSDAFDDVMTDVERTEREREEDEDKNEDESTDA